MADVSHELGALRHIVDSPLSSKVAMFNKVANQHTASQLLNPFTSVDGRSSPKPSFSKDEYGKPIAGSLTELRGQKANIHVCKEMLELCQVINSEGFPDQNDPNLKIIFFGDLFNIYNYISDKLVGLLLRARKHKLVNFEGEILFQRRDDEVPIFLIKSIHEIRAILEAKQAEFRRSVSPAPQPTTVLQDKLIRSGGTSSAPTSKAASPQPEIKKLNTTVTSTALKPPAGQTIHPVITKSTESINNVKKPLVENSKTEQKINLIPSVTINATKSPEIANNVTKPLVEENEKPKIDSTSVKLDIEVPKTNIVENGISDETIIRIDNKPVSKDGLPAIVPAIVPPIVPAIVPEMDLFTQEVPLKKNLNGQADIKSEKILSILSHIELPAILDSELSVVDSETTSDSTSEALSDSGTNSDISVNLEQNNEINKLEKQSESQNNHSEQEQLQLLPVNNIVDITRNAYLIQEVAPQ